MTFERLGDLLDDDTRPHEAVERDTRKWNPGIRHGRRVLALDEFDEARCETVPVRMVQWFVSSSPAKFIYLFFQWDLCKREEEEDKGKMVGMDIEMHVPKPSERIP